MSQLKQEITLLSGIGQLSTTLLGTGLFMVPAIAANIAGEVSLWAWFFLMLGVCPVALTFAELGKQYPNAGGASYFVKQAFGEQYERAVAWLFVSVMPVGIPAAIALASGFAIHFLPAPLNTTLIAEVLTIGLLMVVNLAGTKSSGRIQTLIALSILALVAAFFVKGNIGLHDLSMPSLTVEQLPFVGSALGVMFWCFVGIEAFAHMGEEFKNPRRDFPIAIIIGCIVAGVTYWACSVVILKFNAYGDPSFETSAIPWLSQQLFGDGVKWVISVVGFLACFASINLYTQSLARMIWAQARQYKSEGRLARVSRNGVPANATLLVGSILLISSIVAELTGMELELFLRLANGTFVLVYFLAMIAAVRLLSGVWRKLAFFSALLCASVIICLGWSMGYAIAVFIVLTIVFRFRGISVIL